MSSKHLHLHYSVSILQPSCIHSSSILLHLHFSHRKLLFCIQRPSSTRPVSVLHLSCAYPAPILPPSIRCLSLSVPHLFPNSFLSIPCPLPVRFLSLSCPFPVYSQSIPLLLPIYSSFIPQLFPFHTTSGPHPFPLSFPPVPRMFPVPSLYNPLHILCTFPVCSTSI